MREENQQWSNKKCLVKGRPEWGSENRIWEVSVNWFSVNPKGNQSGIFIGRTDAEAEAEAPMLWPPDVKNWLNGKDPDAGKDWRQEKGTTEDEMVGWLHWLDGHESEQVLGVGDAIQPSHSLSSPSPPFNLSQHQGLFHWVSSSHQVAKVLEFQLQHQPFQWTLRTDLL